MKHLAKVSKLPAKAILREGEPWWEELFEFWRDPVGEILNHLPMISKPVAAA